MEPKRPKRKRTPSIAEQREEMARTGDVDSLFALLRDSRYGDIDFGSTFRLLSRAVMVRSKGDPAQFAEDLYNQMLAFTSYLMLRTHIWMEKAIRRNDEEMRTRGTTTLPRDFADVMLPQLAELHEHISALIVDQATTARSWALARGKEMENDIVAATIPQIPASDRAEDSSASAPRGDETAARANTERDSSLSAPGGGETESRENGERRRDEYQRDPGTPVDESEPRFPSIIPGDTMAAYSATT